MAESNPVEPKATDSPSKDPADESKDDVSRYTESHKTADSVSASAKSGDGSASVAAADDAPETEDDAYSRSTNDDGIPDFIGEAMNALILEDEDEDDSKDGGSSSSAAKKEKTKKKGHPKVAIEEATLAEIARGIRDGTFQKIIVMSGAGISTSCGIPDFRTPGTGLYDNLQRFNLPQPEAVFEINYFRNNPDAFYQLAKELYPGNFTPSVTHQFINFLAKKGLLLRHYTQNIDCLDRLAGVSGELIVEAHGSFSSAHCINKSCKKEHSEQWVKEKVFSDQIPKCDKCDALVKPDIVFFGEGLPERFHSNHPRDLRNADLLLVIGTSLKVQPFASLTEKVRDSTPRVLINLEKVGMREDSGFDADKLIREGMSEQQIMMIRLQLMLLGQQNTKGFRFGGDDNYRDVFLQEKCDEGVRKLVGMVSDEWLSELESDYADTRRRCEGERAQEKAKSAEIS